MNKKTSSKTPAQKAPEQKVTENEFNPSAISEELQKSLLDKAETELEIRRAELTNKRINALVNLRRAETEYGKLKLEQHRLIMDERRLSLEEMQTKYNICSDMVRKSDKLQRVISRTMLGLFPEQDKQVVRILEASKEISKVKSEEI